MLDDSSARAVDVYVPAGHDGQGLPLLVDLAGFTSSGLYHTNWVGFCENVPDCLDRPIGEQRMSPVVVAFPIASPGSAATNTSTQLQRVSGRISCLKVYQEQNSCPSRTTTTLSTTNGKSRHVNSGGRSVRT